MNEEQKREYLEKYQRDKDQGTKFYPDIIYKDLLITFAIFLLLVGMAIFIGVAAEPPADPSDSSYIPRPEWYFLFLFEMLKYFPGAIEWVGTVIDDFGSCKHAASRRGYSSFNVERSNCCWTRCILGLLCGMPRC